ncbi:hypothetical protein BJX66DRAFT_343083 [Aspergillus keveii]|uniref:Uncharacterized protein n=1 Tax=Aspergillus keveii TaxID=714993 RepID=A0ABR4FQD3_9EURO
MHQNPDAEPDTIWDLLIFPTSRPPTQFPSFQDLLMSFLSRFQDDNSHLLGYYGTVTHDILVAAAQFQADILCDNPSSIEITTAAADFSGENTIIALALRCFLDFHILDLIAMDCYGRTVEIAGLPEDGSAVEVLGPDRSDPFLTATAYKVEGERQDRLFDLLSTNTSTTTKTPPPASASAVGCHFNSNLHTMLSTLAHLSFRLLDTHDPRHWPTVLYVLLILALTRQCLRYCLSWMRTLYEAAETVENLFQDLARYHYVCTEGGRILTPRWDREEYAARVGGGCPGSAGAAVKVVEHACLLHDLWFDGEDEGKWNSRERYRGLGGFARKLGDFADGDFHGSSYR